MLCNNGRYVLPCQGRGSAAVSGMPACLQVGVYDPRTGRGLGPLLFGAPTERSIYARFAGLTLLLDEGGQLGWAADLQGFAPPSPDATVSSVVDASLPPPAAPALDWAVCLLSAAVRYEPPDPRKAAAVLTAAAISWRRPAGEQHGSSIEARKLAVHVAGPAASAGSKRNGSSGSSGRRSAVGLHYALSWSETAAAVAGFHQVSAEAGISVQLPPRQQQISSQQQDAQQQPSVQQMQEIAVTNRGLSVTLSRHTLLLLRKLAHQLRSSSSASARSRKVSAIGSSAGNGALSTEAMAGSTSGESSTAAVNVMQGVMQSAYARPQRPAEHPLEASVFLDGELCMGGGLVAVVGQAIVF